MSQRILKTLEEPKIAESYDYAEEVRRQAERCLIAASGNPEGVYNEESHRNAILAYEDLIPKEDRDDELEEDLKNAMIKDKVDIRPKFAGTYLDEETCKELNIPAYQEIEKTDWHKYFRACFNQFVRLKVAVRRPVRA